MIQDKSIALALLDGIPGLGRKSIGARESGFFSRWGWAGGQTHSGKNVTPDVALQNDTVWSCVRLISEAISTLPLFLYERASDGSRRTAPAHVLYDVLHNQPNAKMSAVSFWQAIVASMLLWGNAYAEIKRRSNGEIISLEFLLPAHMRLSWGDNGLIQYTYQTGSGPERPIARADVMHIKAFTLDGEVGLSAIQYGRNAIGSALSQDQASDETFRNASRASGLVTMDAVMNKDQREQVRQHVNDVSRTGGVFVLEKGAGFVQLGFNPHDAELLATRSFSVETICRWFRVPPVMVGHGDKASSWPTSTEAQGALFLRYVLRGMIMGIEQEVRRSLLTPAERTRYFAEYSIEGLLRGDTTTRAAFYASALQNGYMTRDTVCRLENLPLVKGGDIATVQSSMIALGDLGKAPPGETVRDAVAKWLNIGEGAPNADKIPSN